ncbi:hypothetical protein F9L07_15295 [Pimelobacter simplex]|uniref:Uncharacterized protein n=1 Tax=Nocardioides simplex TaxID=2045 RepID=A0A7J5E484_NOCSI|nr:hypothetical protein [Pimelobacter simplex]KAB2813058.1 hypothetical protein F9L07_15295 [Pimelobacter simplex]
MPFLPPREVDTELRYVVPVASTEVCEYLIVVAMKGAPFLPKNQFPTPISPLLNWMEELVELRIGRRSPVRKVGIFERRHSWSRAKLRFETWTPSLEEADALVNELYAELEAGVRRWAS